MNKQIKKILAFVIVLFVTLVSVMAFLVNKNLKEANDILKDRQYCFRQSEIKNLSKGTSEYMDYIHELQDKGMSDQEIDVEVKKLFSKERDQFDLDYNECLESR